MSELTDEACRLIKQATPEEQRIILTYLRERVPIHALEGQWNTTAEEILTAIARSADITLRGVRGILAEAIFEKRLLPKLETDGWEGFAFTVGSWLLPRKDEQSLIEIMQPVAVIPDEYWTDDLGRCIEWFFEGADKQIYS